MLQYKVFIIDEVHMLSGSAFNALLKTLEEPPEHAMFILATTEIHKVPETILSRCQRFSFQRIGVTHLIERLEQIAKHEKIKIDKDVIADIAARAEGSSRDAESLLGQLMAFGHGHITHEQAAVLLPRSSMQDAARLTQLLYARDSKASMEYITSFIEDGGNADEFLKDCIVFVRLTLLQMTHSKKLEAYVEVQVSEEVRKILSTIASSHSLHETLMLLDLLLRAKSRYVYPDIPQLALEMVVGEFCAPEESTPKPPTSPSSGATVEANTLFPEKTSDKKKSESRATRINAEISFSVLKEKWQDFTNAVRKVNRGLSMSMQVARPVDISGTHVTLHVPYAFHKERIDMAQHRRLIEDAMTEYFGKPMTIACEVSTLRDSQTESGSNVEKVKGDKLWDQVLDAFSDQLAPSQD